MDINIDDDVIKKMSSALEKIKDTSRIISDLDILVQESRLATASEEDNFFCIFGGMFFTAPMLLHELVRKCHDEKHEVKERFKKILEAEGFMVNGIVPLNIKSYITKHFKVTDENGICMHA